MPELPEVETVRLQLQKYLVGHKVLDVEVKIASIFSGNVNDLIGSEIKDVRRFAKVLSIDLSKGYSVVIHIKLTGQLIYRGPNLSPKGGNFPQLSNKVVGGVPGPHTHVIFKLSEAGFLYYNDIRRFGWLRVIKTKDVENTGFVAKLGPEPFGSAQGKPQKLTFEYFTKMLSKSKRQVKVVIMDQEKMGGVGNIYANDALWLSRINPKMASNSLDSSQQKVLFDAVHSVLRQGLKYGGASELAFVTPDGAEGEYQNHTLVYGHQGETCKRCKKSKIKKFFLGGRGTYICPVCQAE